MKGAWMVLGLALAATACASSGRQFDERRVQDVKQGVTTRADVERWFGAPQSRTTLTDQPSGAVLRYIYVWAHASWGGASAHAKSFVADFDAHDVVVGSGYSEN